MESFIVIKCDSKGLSSRMLEILTKYKAWTVGGRG